MFPSYTKEAFKSVTLDKVLNLSKLKRTSNKNDLWKFETDKAKQVLKNYKIDKTISAQEAIRKFENKDGFFVSLFQDNLTISGFHQCAYDNVKYNIKKLGELAKNHNDVYLIDEIGSSSILVSEMLKSDEAFNGKNVIVIKGGILHWVYENGPVDITDTKILAAEQKVAKEREAENYESFYRTYFKTDTFDAEEFRGTLDFDTGDIIPADPLEGVELGHEHAKILKNFGA